MSGLGPPILNSSIRSWNCPWMSPQTVTGHFWSKVSPSVAERGGRGTYHWLYVRLFLEYFASLSCHLVSMCLYVASYCARRRIPCRTASARRSLPIACIASGSQSSRPGLGLWWAPTRGQTRAAWARASSRPPCLCPWRRRGGFGDGQVGGRLLWRLSCRGVLALSNLADDVPPAGNGVRCEERLCGGGQ